MNLKGGDRIAVVSRAAEDRGWWKGWLNGRVSLYVSFHMLTLWNPCVIFSHSTELTTQSIFNIRFNHSIFRNIGYFPPHLKTFLVNFPLDFLKNRLHVKVFIILLIPNKIKVLPRRFCDYQWFSVVHILFCCVIILNCFDLLTLQIFSLISLLLIYFQVVTLPYYEITSNFLLYIIAFSKSK